MSAQENADVLDQATELTQTLTNAYISNVQDAAKPEQQRMDDGRWPITECVGPGRGDECGEPIPEARLALGKIRCLACQQDREAAARARARG
jgi:RNA polymerase-binding transcription factor DksA